MATVSERTTTVQIATRVPADIAERLEELAEENERTMAAELRLAARRYVNAEKPREAAARPA